jgi:hypothetical protein
MDLQDHTPAATPDAGGGTTDFEIAVQMLELNEMRAEGTITEEEFAGWVAELLPAG